MASAIAVRDLRPQRFDIALVGKYVDLTESYKSLSEALTHAGRTWAHAFALPDGFGGGEVPFHTIMVRESKAMDVPEKV